MGYLMTLSFKQLKQFNLALLAKQGWRLQSSLEYLLFRVFKSRYFPNYDFVHAGMGSSPSFAWRSLMAMQEVVKKGARWQVSNGQDIQIWEDKWLPCLSTHKVVSPPTILSSNAMVDTLINAKDGTWNMVLLQQLFLPHEVDIILGIALSTNLPGDRLVWAPTENGLFTVKSTYKIAMEMQEGAALGTVSDDSNLRKFWKYIWQMNIPYKVRHFTWRSCRNILPTKDNLLRRKIVTDGCCEECCKDVESSGHLFWECSWARKIWALSNLFPAMKDLQFRSFMDLLWYSVMAAKWDRETIEKIVMISWKLWTHRNEVRNGGARKNEKALIASALVYLEDYHSCVAVTTRNLEKRQAVWIPPPINLYKINVDSAVFSALGAAGAGVLIRDGNGSMIGACCKKFQAPFGAIEAEAKAIELTMQMAKDLLI